MSEQPLASSTMAPSPAAAEQDVAAAAERLQDLAWSMRERDLELATCTQIEELAAAILSASSLCNPADHRAQPLGAALRLLEQRIEAMLADAATRAKAPSADAAAEAPPLLELTPAREARDTVPAHEDARDVMAEIESELFANAGAPTIEPPAAAKPRSGPSDPLAALRTLSDEELIALFT